MASFDVDLVHCHIGSLENSQDYLYINGVVHCHIGSLEISDNLNKLFTLVHCHIGSLEIVAVQ